MKKVTIDFSFLRILISAILFGSAFFLPEGIWSLSFFLVSYLIVGYDVLWKAILGIIHGKLFDETFLMSIATIGAFAIGEFPEGVAVMLFYQFGEWLGDLAVDKSKESITSLMDLRSDFARVKRKDQLQKVDPSLVEIGESIVVRPGERVPLDGIVLDGTSHLDTSSLTGESAPRVVRQGDAILSGVISLDGVLEIKTTTTSAESTVSRILDLIQNASEKKAPTERFITKFSKVYTPIVVVLAVLLYLIPVVFLHLESSTWLYRALVFLVISCPCALVISIPLGFFCGIGVSSKYGVLIKGSNELEKLMHTSTFVFDKTGTITKGNFEVIAMDGKNLEQLVYYAACLESESLHPIALSIQKLYDKEIDRKKIKNLRELSGNGIEATIDQKKVMIGKKEFFKNHKIEVPEVKAIGTIVYLAVDGMYFGHFVIADQVKNDAREALSLLKEEGVGRIVMLSGDNADIVSHIAKEVGITESYANLLPEDKVHMIEAIKDEEVGYVAFVGDGINDAPVLMASDLGISMGGIGSDAAIEASDVVLMDDRPSKISKAIQISKRTNRIVWQNIIFAISIKILILILGAFGISSIWGAVFADVGVTLLAILNALRILSYRY